MYYTAQHSTSNKRNRIKGNYKRKRVIRRIAVSSLDEFPGTRGVKTRPAITNAQWGCPSCRARLLFYLDRFCYTLFCYYSLRYYCIIVALHCACLNRRRRRRRRQLYFNTTPPTYQCTITFNQLTTREI